MATTETLEEYRIDMFEETLRQLRESLKAKVQAIDVLLGDNGRPELGPPQLSPAIEITTPETIDEPKVPAPRKRNKRNHAKRKKAKRSNASKKAKRSNASKKSIDWSVVRERWETGERASNLARELGVSSSAIYYQKEKQGWERRKIQHARPAPAGMCPSCRLELTNSACSHCGYRE